ncbi:hypothetical protein NQ315_010182 [Exocentrus adspersus]|uniref:Uncharacterized protein n=1 Tax=Exocentrus adspersus TaxID=1586481 RepID=A0AAV8WAJ5_9CUCU|nr:hypothetical protein NQ315_010182 [Exocentrus adspersus]
MNRYISQHLGLKGCRLNMVTVLFMYGINAHARNSAHHIIQIQTRQFWKSVIHSYQHPKATMSNKSITLAVCEF